MKKIFLIFVVALFNFNIDVKASNIVEKESFHLRTVETYNFLDNTSNLLYINFNNSVENLDNNTLEPPNTGIKINYTMYAFVFVGIIILKKIYNYSKK